MSLGDEHRKANKHKFFKGMSSLGRRESDPGMAESKSDRLFNDFNAHLEKLDQNALQRHSSGSRKGSAISAWCARRTAAVIEVAIKAFGVTKPQRQKRLAAQPVEIETGVAKRPQQPPNFG